MLYILIVPGGFGWMPFGVSGSWFVSSFAGFEPVYLFINGEEALSCLASKGAGCSLTLYKWGRSVPVKKRKNDRREKELFDY